MTQTQQTARFDRSTFLALDPRAFGATFIIPASRDNTRIGDCEIVDVSGPLCSRLDALFDSYPDVLGRVSQACSSDASTVCLLIDSCGGEVQGAFEAARQIRAMCAASGKRLIAHADGHCSSAAYALATSASQITCSATSAVGGIGVILRRPDISEQLARDGVRVHLVASGARKGDGVDTSAATDPELQELQSQVDQLAGLFADLVVAHRPALTAASAVLQLQARTFIGSRAVEAGLVDRVESFDTALSDTTHGVVSMTFSELVAALGEMVEAGGDDGVKAAKMLQAVAAVEVSTPAAPAPDPAPEGATGDEDEPAAADETPPAEDDEKKDKDKPEAADAAPAVAAHSGVADKLLAQLAATVQKQSTALASMQAALAAQTADAERREFLASRPDLSPELVAVFADRPVAELRAVAAQIPVKQVTATLKAGSITTLPVTRGQGQGGPAKAVAKSGNAELDSVFFGGSKPVSGEVVAPNVMRFGATTKAGA